MTPRPLNTDDVAKLLSTTPAAVHKLVQSGKLKAHRSGRGKPVRYDTESVAGEMIERKSRHRQRQARRR